MDISLKKHYGYVEGYRSDGSNQSANIVKIQ